MRDAAVAAECYSNWVAVDQLQRVAALDWAEALGAAGLAPAIGALPGRSALERLNRVKLSGDRVERLLNSEPELAPPVPSPTPPSDAAPTGLEPSVEAEQRALTSVLERRLGDLRFLLPFGDPETFGAYWLLEHADPMALIRRIASTDLIRGAQLPPLVLAAERVSGSESERLEKGAAESYTLGPAFETPFYRPKRSLYPANFLSTLRGGEWIDQLYFDNSRDTRRRRGVQGATLRWAAEPQNLVTASPLVLAIEIESRGSLGLTVANPGARMAGLAAAEVVVTPPVGEPRRARIAEIGRDARDVGTIWLAGRKSSRLEFAVGWREDGSGGPLFDEAGTYRVKALYRPLVLGKVTSQHLDPVESRESETWVVRVADAPPGDQACRKALEAIGWLKAGVSVERPDREGPAHPDWPTVCAGTSFAPRLLLFDLERAIQAMELAEPASILPRNRAELDRLASDPTFALRGKAEELRLRLARLAELRENSQ